MGQSLFDSRPILTRQEIVWVIGLILGGMGYGALLTLGVSSLFAFARSPWKGQGWCRHEKILFVHVLLVLLFNTFLQVWNAKANIKAIFYTDPDHVTYFYHGWANVFVLLLAALTEGIFVWRCYMVQKVLPGSSASIWHIFCWVFPAFLWLAEIGITSLVLLNPTASLFDKAESNSLALTIFMVVLIVNFTLNVFAASNIIIRLLLHRQSVIAAFGHASILGEDSLRISSILLESAAINLPSALFGFFGFLIRSDYTALVVQIITVAQCIASVLVTYQVAKRRTVSERRATTSMHELPRVSDYEISHSQVVQKGR